MRRIFFLLMLVFSVQSHALPEISGKVLTIAVGPSLGGSNASVVLVRVEGHEKKGTDLFFGQKEKGDRFIFQEKKKGTDLFSDLFFFL